MKGVITIFRVNLSNVGQQRTIRPLYAQTQATPWAGYLDPAWDRSVDILPGMVMARTGAGEVFTLAKDTTQKGFGLAALWVAPNGSSIDGPIDEVAGTGTNNFTVWVGGPDALFEILAPAFDTSADYTLPTDGTRKMLSHTTSAHAQGAGKLTVSGGTNAASNAIAELVAFQPGKLTVRLNVVA